MFECELKENCPEISKYKIKEYENKIKIESFKLKISEMRTLLSKYQEILKNKNEINKRDITELERNYLMNMIKENLAYSNILLFALEGNQKALENIALYEETDGYLRLIKKGSLTEVTKQMVSTLSQCMSVIFEKDGQKELNNMDYYLMESVQELLNKGELYHGILDDIKQKVNNSINDSTKTLNLLE